jgi:hypothetical protein
MSESPYLTPNGELRIPRDAPQRYKWWAGGEQSIWQTLAEIDAPLKTWRQYAYASADLSTPAHADRCEGVVVSREGFAYCAICGRYKEA